MSAEFTCFLTHNIVLFILCLSYIWLIKLNLKCSQIHIPVVMSFIQSSVLMHCCLEQSKVMGIQCWLSTLPHMCRDFWGISESFYNIMDCRWVSTLYYLMQSYLNWPLGVLLIFLLTKTSISLGKQSHSEISCSCWFLVSPHIHFLFE